MDVVGVTDYGESLDWQQRLVNLRSKDRTEDVLLLLEHQPVITVGTKDLPRFKVSEEEIKRRGIRIFDINRSGGATYHGPGQLVAYAITDFKRLFGYDDSKPYVPTSEISKFTGRLEEVMRRTLADFGISNGVELNKGVWHNDSKIGSRAIGVVYQNQRAITMHGAALDVNTDQKYFELIFPCGHTDKGVTSMKKVLGKDLPMDQVKSSFMKNFGEVFDYTMYRAALDEVLRLSEDL